MRDYKARSGESRQKYLRRRRRTLTTKKDKRARAVRFFKGLLVLWVAGAMLYIATMGARSLLLSGFFDVRKIEYEGHHRLGYEELERLSGIGPALSGNIFSVDIKETCRRVAASPWVKDVSVRRMLPHRIRVEVVERVPAAVLSSGGHLYLADREGVVLDHASDADQAALPLVSGIKVDAGQAEDAATEKVAAALELAAFLKEREFAAPDDLVDIRVEDPQSVVLLYNGVEIRLGRGGYPEKFKRLAEVEPDIRRRQIRVLYIDLRFSDKVVIKPAEEEGQEGNKEKQTTGGRV